MATATRTTTDSDVYDDEPSVGKIKSIVYQKNVINITLMQDKQARLVELVINRCQSVPRLLLKLIGICLPYHPTCEKIILHWCPLDSVCLYEVSKFLFGYESRLSEIYLDDSPVKGRNYYLLLDRPSNLRVLSLARCNLDDYDLIAITSLLKYPLPASKTLVILNLSMNNIGDRGACALGEILRSNRMLQYINLAGNHVTSEGAICILKSLMEFSLMSEETSDKRLRLLVYIKQKEEVYKKCLVDLAMEKTPDHHADTSSKKRAQGRGKGRSSLGYNTSASTLQQRAHTMTVEMIGQYSDPFSNDQTMTYDDRTYSFGNMVLSCLNLSYNNLDYASVPVLLEVLKYQSALPSKRGTGLLRVLIEGNNMPVHCDEYDAMAELIEKEVITRITPPSKTPQLKTSKRQHDKMSNK